MSVVLLLSRQRSGTGALTSALEQHPNISYCGEVLDPSCNGRPFFKWIHDKGEILKTPYDACNHFKCYVKDLLDENKINIIDIKYNSLSAFSSPFYTISGTPWILDFLSRIPVPMIHLKRNLIDCYVSGKLAEQSGIYHTSDESNIRKSSITVDTKSLINFYKEALLENRVIEKFFDGYGFHCSLNYEKCFSDDGKVSNYAIDSISNLLKLDLSMLDRKSKILKQTSSQLREKVDNIEDVVYCLSHIIESSMNRN